MKSFQTLILFAFSFGLYAQVGVNTENPNQALHVDGKVQIGDDSLTPTEGTIRYNQTTKDFEGFDGTNWISLTGRQEYAKVTSPNSSQDPFFNWTQESDNTVSFTVTFSKPMDPSTFTVGENFIVEGYAEASGTLTWSNNNTEVTFRSNETFNDFASCFITLTIKGNGDNPVKDQAGFIIDGDNNNSPGGDFIYQYQILC